jgi:hypothetical protein
MRYISLEALNNLQHAFRTNPYGYSLDVFRHALGGKNDSDEHARVLFTANDGNDYAIVEVINGGDEYWFIGITNSVDDKVGDLIAFSKHDSYRDALAEMSNMSATDLDL